MHWVTGLESSHSTPTFFVEKRTGFSRCHVGISILNGEIPLRKYFHGTRKVNVALLHHHFHSRMSDIRGSKYSLAFMVFVDRVDLADG